MCGGGARGVRGQGAPFPLQPLRVRRRMHASRHRRHLGFPKSAGRSGVGQLFLMRPGPAGRASSGTPPFLRGRRARGGTLGGAGALGRSNGGRLAAESPVPEWGRISGKGRRGSGSETRGEVLLVLSQGGRGWAAYSQRSSFSENPFPVPSLHGGGGPVIGPSDWG